MTERLQKMATAKVNKDQMDKQADAADGGNKANKKQAIEKKKKLQGDITQAKWQAMQTQMKKNQKVNIQKRMRVKRGKEAKKYVDSEPSEEDETDRLRRI